jgi:hypothetical protein
MRATQVPGVLAVRKREKKPSDGDQFWKLRQAAAIADLRMRAFDGYQHGAGFSLISGLTITISSPKKAIVFPNCLPPAIECRHDEELY